tara:strand:- start:1116 stop:1796 length:681 start_codon:yes stop_codon:yes gene_type:complete
MQWPTLIVDNFFTDPHGVVKLSKTLKYAPSANHAWPGTRTAPLHEVNNAFFQWSTQKILALLYPAHIPPQSSAQILDSDGLQWHAGQYFQRVPFDTYGEEGWVHRDIEDEFTVIIYLSDHPQSGTCLYEGKYFNTQAEHLDEKQKFYADLKDLKRMEKYKEKCNSKFRKKVELFSNFNRLVLFDGANWHASKNADESKSERLTLITFFKDVSCKNIRYPITQMRRI